MIGPELRHNLRSGYARLVRLVGREADGAHACMATASVALADLRQIYHLGRVGLGPGIRTTETLVRKLDFDRPIE